MLQLLTAVRQGLRRKANRWLRQVRSRRWGVVAERTLRRTLNEQSFDLAGSVAFWAFFSLFPLLLGLIAGLSFVFDSAQVQGRLIARAAEALPAGADLIEHNLETVVRLRRAFGVAAILGLFWSASAGIAALSRAVSWGWGSEASAPRLQRLRVFAMAFAMYFLLIAVVVVTTTLRLFRFAQLWLFESMGVYTPMLSVVIATLLGLMPVFLLFCAIYRFLNYDRVKLAQVWPAALLATVLFEISKQLFLVYLDHFAQYELVYGSLSSVILLQLWLYLVAFIVILSGAFGRARLEVESDRS